jgi:fatty acid synthase subunit beta
MLTSTTKRIMVSRKYFDPLSDSNIETGFKITDIVKNDPKEMTIFFGGPRGRHIRDVYMSMKYDQISPDGTTRVVKLFKDIDEETESHTYRSAKGLLSSTEFTQPALALMELAIFFDLQERGLISDESPYAGHSLGEYSGLCAVANIMSIESLTSTVFYRGLTMQVAVERDELGRSEFGMMAVDPSRLTKGKNFVYCFSKLLAKSKQDLMRLH